MPRIRTIKPSFFESGDVAVLPFRARLLWIGLWTHCDDQGRTKDNLKLIKARIWPLDQVSLRDIEDDLETLASHGRIVRYAVAGETYLAIVNWHEHQSINKPTPSKLPPPPTLPDTSRSSPVAVPEDSGGERKGKEGKGKEGSAGARETPPASVDPGPEPPSKCPQHIEDPDPPPCRRCKQAREAHDLWQIEHLRLETLAKAQAAKQRAAELQARIDACKLCDHNGYLGDVLCTHDPARPPPPTSPPVAGKVLSADEARALARQAAKSKWRPTPTRNPFDPVAEARRDPGTLDALDSALAELPPQEAPYDPD